MVCPKCNTRNSAGYRFCKNCGTLLNADKQSKTSLKQTKFLDINNPIARIGIGGLLLVIFIVLGVSLINISKRLTLTRNSLATTQSQLAATQNELTTTTNQLVATQNELASTKSQLAVTQNELTTTKNQLATTQNQLQSSQSQVLTLTNQLTTSQNQLVTTQNQLATAQIQVTQLANTDNAQVITAKTTLNQFLSNAKANNYQAMWSMLSSECQALYSDESDFESNNIVAEKDGYYLLSSYYVGAGNLLST